jgi:hypothetical protein
MRDTDALKHLKRAAAELAEIRRGKEFAQWNEYEKHHLDSELADSEPFRSWRDTFIFTGDGAFVTANGRFGPWAIGRLVSRLSAEEVLAAFHAEITRNSVVYSEVMPLFGVQIDAPSWRTGSRSSLGPTTCSRPMRGISGPPSCAHRPRAPVSFAKCTR